MSLILYLFYNANLLDILNDENINVIAIDYINDIVIIVIESSFEKNNDKLN